MYTHTHSYTHAHTHIHIHTHLHEPFDAEPMPFLCRFSCINHTLNASSMISCFHVFKVEGEVTDALEEKSDCKILL